MRITLFLLLFLSLACTAKKLIYEQEINKYRDNYKRKFLKYSEAPLSKDQISYLRFYDVDSSFCVDAKIERLKNQQPLEFKTSSGKTKQYIPFIKAHFLMNQEFHTVTIFKSVELMSNPLYKDYLFLPFTDLTNGEMTYGGGRYLDFREKDIRNERLKLDFNKAYNPYCAYSSGYNCPIPPKSNFINVEIIAGEKKYEGEYNH